MEVEKLLNVLFDIENDEEGLDISTILTNTINAVANTNSSPNENNFKALQDYMEELRNAFKDSFTSYYPPSDIRVLEKISATNYVGNSAWAYIDSLINENRYSTSQLINKLNEYQTNRSNFLKKAKELANGLKHFKFTPKVHNDEEIYSVGVLFPEKFSELPLLEKQLHRWNIVFKHLNELTGSGTADSKVNYISTGSLEFFFDQGPQTAAALGQLLIGIVEVYKKLISLRGAREKLKEFKIPPVEEKIIKAHEKTLVDEQIKTVVRDVVRIYKDGTLVEERIKELEVAVAKDSYFIAKAVDKGITIEIKPPELLDLDTPKDSENESDKEGKDKLKKIAVERDKRIEQVRTAGAILKDFSEIGKNILQLAPGQTKGAEGKDEKDNEEPVDLFGDSADSLLT